jgi:hypothetical protein
VKVHETFDEKLQSFVLRQHVFFVATAPSSPGGHVNVSPKSIDGAFAVLDAQTVAYVDYVASGVETIAHLRNNGRIVLMFCAFEGPPNIVRLHGRGEVRLPDDDGFAELVGRFKVDAEHPAIRSIIVVHIERVSDSCGYTVPLYDYAGERGLLLPHMARKGADGISAYKAEKNATSIDGLPGL